MKKLFVLHLILIILTSGCTFNVDVLAPTRPVTDSSQLTPYTTQIIPSPLATISATAELPSPTPVPPTTDPLFFNARTSSSPNDINPQSTFPERIKAVYAIWDYQNMREGLKIRREWYLDGRLWLTREETWDFKKYGADGTIRDISIYDNDTGLDSGGYQLRLYINNALQPIGPGISAPVQPWITFVIGMEKTPQPIASPAVPGVAGDLGVGMIHGKIIDAATVAPISNASVTCEQHSYTSSSPCSGTVLTNSDGTYAFNNVFFHDTDTIKIIVQAAGYQSQVVSKTSFTTNDLLLDLALSPTP